MVSRNLVAGACMEVDSVQDVTLAASADGLIWSAAVSPTRIGWTRAKRQAIPAGAAAFFGPELDRPSTG